MANTLPVNQVKGQKRENVAVQQEIFLDLALAGE